MKRTLPPRFKLTSPAPSAVQKVPHLSLDHRRGTAHHRGYDSKWERMAVAYRKRRPWCEWCLQEGRDDVLAALVDHMIPVVDRLALLHVWSNCWAICSSCHGRKLSMEIYARQHGLLDQLPSWCKDPSSRPQQFRPIVSQGIKP